MKYNYDEMSSFELSCLYDSIFGEFFAIAWDDDSDHREDKIACIESGIPQAKDGSYPWTVVPKGCIA